MSTSDQSEVLDVVKNYYGKKLTKTSDLELPGCVNTGDVTSKDVRDALALVHDEVANRYYGCGLVIPDKLDKMSILDLGSGSGRDCFAASKLVGPDGSVTGIDMTQEQLDVSRRYIDYHTEKFGYKTPNICFVHGYIEKLIEAGLQENFYDIIISNCVVNLSPDKRAVLSEAYKVLKEGGELFFSDVYADRILPENVRKHEVLYGECIAGALCWKELYDLAEDLGFSRPRLVTASPIPIDRDDFKVILGGAQFSSVTFRLFKLPDMKQKPATVTYRGDIKCCEDQLKFDHQLTFKTGIPSKVDAETASILSSSRFKENFDIQSECCGSNSVARTDPFLYLTELTKKGQEPAPACCGVKKCC